MYCNSLHSQELIKKLEEAETSIRAHKCEAHARGFLESLAAQQKETTEGTVAAEVSHEVTLNVIDNRMCLGRTARLNVSFNQYI